MAWIFSLSAEIGSDEKSAIIFAGYFQWLTYIDYKTRQYQCRVDTFRDIENNWWCRVYPNNISEVGIDHPKTAGLMTELGNLLYEHLHSVNLLCEDKGFLFPFRYALVGVEVDEFRTYSELIEDLPNLSIPGLVLSTELTQGLETLSGFQEFSSGYIWQPYKGEVYHPSMALQT
ncbi:hypothetical protein B6N60_02766 [Richelia sinica FACHB-800]|uniref:Uncharacterized protein n=1 Tax=Richelia sinica FACHB-800 TaxID=1357546 RepID=A0A975T8B3_9NOST|nr:hypothetical protein [Richelia sinica]QXE24063.1 hypothetical protein B6N60_02766 [Richelia sinica FACHB-800]